MTAEEQRIAIAEACGLNPYKLPMNLGECKATRWFSPSAASAFRKCYKNAMVVKVIPDYLNDLNAMHEAEKVVIGNLHAWWAYCAHLAKIVPAELGNESHVRATAAQRAEAFLRTLNKWKE